MALTKSLITETVFGNQAVQVWDITPDAAATSFSTTMSAVKFVIPGWKSAVTDATFGVISENKLPAGTASAGDIAMTSVVGNGNATYRLVVFGTR